jgi:hypothetical protein
VNLTGSENPQNLRSGSGGVIDGDTKDRSVVPDAADQGHLFECRD